MKNLLRALFVLPITLLANTSTQTTIDNNNRSTLKNFSFNYFVSYNGPSLDSSYQSGATFNRFDGGVDKDGKSYDTTGSEQIYQSFKLAYQFSNNHSLSFGVTMQENLYDDIKFRYNWGGTGTRSSDRSYNGHRLSYYIPSLISFNGGWVGSSFYAQKPIAAERFNGTKYTYGLQPYIGFYSKVEGLFHGVSLGFERVVMEKEVENNLQGVLVSVTPTIGYNINSNWALKHSFNFEWDQKGGDIGSGRFSKNMHDIGKTGIGYQVFHNAWLDTYLTYSVSKFDKKYTALGASFNLTL